MEVRNSKMGGRKPTLSNKTTPNRTPTLLGAGANTTGMDLQQKAAAAAEGKVGIEDLKIMVAEFAADQLDKENAMIALEEEKELMAEDFQGQINLIKDEFEKVTTQALQDAQNAEEKITLLEEEVAKAQAAADVALKGTALD